MIRVFVAAHPAEAHLVKGMLETAGIPCEIRREALFGAAGEVPVFDARPEVWVTDEQAATARELIEAPFADESTGDQ